MNPLRRGRGFCGCGLLAGLLAAMVVLALLESGVFKPSSPPMQVRLELEAWTQAVVFVKNRLGNPENAQFPPYSPVFVRKVSGNSWEVTATVTLLDGDGLPGQRKVFRVLEKREEKTGWTLSEISLSP